MAEREFDEALEQARPRRGIPLWFWGCGGGCLLMLALAIGFFVFVADRIQSSTGPEVAWPIVERVLPCEQRPEGVEAQVFPLDGFVDLALGRLSTDEIVAMDHMLLLTPVPESGEQTRTIRTLMLMRPNPETERDVADLFGLEESQAQWEDRAFALQGRDVVGRWSDVGEATQEEGEGSMPQFMRGFGSMEDAEVLVLDLTADRERRLVALWYAHGGLRATPESLVEFLDPFDVWGGQ